ncbi:MAG: LPS-assembly protein LptD [Candidatus Eutrophobiaceae bacterium]
MPPKTSPHIPQSLFDEACLRFSQRVWGFAIFLFCAPLCAGTHLSEVQDASPLNISLCPAAHKIPALPAVDHKVSPGDIYAIADKVDLAGKGISVLRGNAQISFSGQHATADVIEYSKTDDTAQLRGNVEYWENGAYVRSSAARLDLETEHGVFTDARYVFESTEQGVDKIRGRASEISMVRHRQTHLKEASYTSCLSSNPLWELRAESIDLEHENNRGVGKHAKLYVADMPVLYWPWVSFPLNRIRKSGFLVPSYGSSTRNGAQFLLPWYWNIAPDQDATITPMLFVDNGFMLRGEYRYLIDSGADDNSPAQDGELNIEYMPMDNKMDDEDRSFFRWRHKQRFLDDRLAVNLLYNRVSDKTYFKDISQQQSLSSIYFLERVMTLNSSGGFSNGDFWDTRLRVQDYQTVDRELSTSDRPYKRMPEWILQYRSGRRTGFKYGMGYELTFFDRSGKSGTEEAKDVTGLRQHVHPYMAYRAESRPGYLESRLGLQYTRYSLNSNGRFKKDINRALPVFNMDGVLNFEREFSMLGSEYHQTLTPRLYYLYVPERNQEGVPVFDSGMYTFGYNTTLFSQNRFSGRDRIGDANQVTVAVGTELHTRSQTREGRYNPQRKIAGMSLSQIFYFKDRKVTLPDAAQRRDSSSTMVGKGSFHPFEAWSLNGAMHWNPHSSSTGRSSIALGYQPGLHRAVNLSYRYHRDLEDSVGSNVEQLDATTQWRLFKRWSLLGRWNYALQGRQLLSAFAGVEYNGCCFSLRFVARRYLTSGSESDNGFFLQLALKGLTEFGNGSLDFIEEQLPGYSRPFL